MRDLIEGQVLKMKDNSKVLFVCYSSVKEDGFIGRYITDKGIRRPMFGFIINDIVEVVEV
ncbi:MAG: hypothetical protein ACRDD7_17725 [Peptostreptococcaceae bacterium]